MRKLVYLLMVVGACDEDDPVRHLDGGMADAPTMVDAPTTPQPVTLTVINDGAPQADVRVYFVNPDSSLISNTVTDSTGVASALMPNGGYVSAVSPFSAPLPTGLPTQNESLYTWAGVKPGDHLTLTVRSGASVSTTVTAAVDTDPNVTGYEFWTPCGSSNTGAPGSGAQPSADFDLDPQCATTTDFMVLSVDGNGDVVHWVYAPNHAVTATIDLTAMAFTNVPSTKTYTLNNADAFGSEMQVMQSLVSQRGEAVKRFGTANGKGSPFTLTMTNPNFANAIDLVQLSGTTSNGYGEHNLLDWGPYSTSYTVDVGARTLVDLTQNPDIDTTAHQLTYTTSGGVAPEFVLAFGDASRTGLNFDWAILAPYGASVQFPTLPTDVADFTIKSDDSYGVDAMLFGKVPGGYDAVRAKLVDLMLGESGPLDLVTTATGAITIEMYQRPRVEAARTTRPAKTPALGRWFSHASK